MGILAACAVVAAVILWQWRRSGQVLVHYLGLGLVYLYARLWHRWSANGPARVPARGPAILVSNHTCSADPAFLTAGCARPLSFVIAREYYNIGLLRPLFDYIGCVPVARNGRDAVGVRVALRRLEEGRVLCIFPEGGLSHAGRRGIRPGKAGVALLALRSRVPVFPALISGGPQTTSLLRAWLGSSRVRVTFGPAVDLSPYYDRPIDRKLLEEVTGMLMHRVAELDRVSS